MRATVDDRHKNGPVHKPNRSYARLRRDQRITRYEAHVGRERARTMNPLKDLQSRLAALTVNQFSAL